MVRTLADERRRPTRPRACVTANRSPQDSCPLDGGYFETIFRTLHSLSSGTLSFTLDIRTSCMLSLNTPIRPCLDIIKNFSLASRYPIIITSICSPIATPLITTAR